MAQTKTKIPTQADFEKSLKELKESTTILRRVTADRDNAIRKVQDKHQPEINRLTALGDAARVVIQDYSNAHRKLDLLPEGAKSVVLNGVKLGWKLNPPALVLVSGVTEEDALARVQEMLPDCVRVKSELIKPLLKAYAESEEKRQTVLDCGLELKREEKFYAEPENA